MPKDTCGSDMKASSVITVEGCFLSITLDPGSVTLAYRRALLLSHHVGAVHQQTHPHCQADFDQLQLQWRQQSLLLQGTLGYAAGVCCFQGD